MCDKGHLVQCLVSMSRNETYGLVAYLLSVILVSPHLASLSEPVTKVPDEEHGDLCQLVAEDEETHQHEQRPAD